VSGEEPRVPNRRAEPHLVVGPGREGRSEVPGDGIPPKGASPLLPRAEDFEAGGFLPASFLDWPGRVAAILFAKGCNLRCPWCHNPDLALGRADDYPISAVFEAIRERRPFLDGLIVSGGEPAIQSALLPLLREIRKVFSLPVCLDTNGTRPEAVESCLEEGLIARVALDLKAPPRLYPRLCGVPVDPAPVLRTLELLRAFAREGRCEAEVRTTLVPGFLDDGAISEIRDLVGDLPWRRQDYRPDRVLAPEVMAASGVS
jgi:pyruvate formate lyase activating enzyme